MRQPRFKHIREAKESQTVRKLMSRVNKLETRLEALEKSAAFAEVKDVNDKS